MSMYRSSLASPARARSALSLSRCAADSSAPSRVSRVRLRPLQGDERGFASIVVALMLIIVLALITVGFAQLSRREQQNALNKQLATQAFDAAETGIDDVRQMQLDNPADLDAFSPTSCASPTDLAADGYPQMINTQDSVSNTCLLIDTEPQHPTYGMQPNENQTLGFTTVDASDRDTPVDLSSLTVDWSSSDEQTTFSDLTHGFPPASQVQWGNPAVLELSLTPLGAGTGFSRSDLTNQTFTTYLYPVNTTGDTITYDTSPADQGTIHRAACVNTPADPSIKSSCTATITIPASTPTSPAGYLIHFLDLYDPAQVTFGANGATPNDPLDFVGAQTMVDSTGKAQDVLKRLQVYLPDAGYDSDPNYAIEGQNVCKRIQTDPYSTAYIDPGGGPAIPGGPCDLSN
jgi:hypothetical protein